MKLSLAILSILVSTAVSPYARATDLTGALTVEQRRQIAAANSPEEAQALREKFGIAKAEDADLDETIERYNQRPEEAEAREQLRSSLRKAYYSTESVEDREKIREAFKSNPMPAEASRAPASLPQVSRSTGR